MSGFLEEGEYSKINSPAAVQYLKGSSYYEDKCNNTCLFLKPLKKGSEYLPGLRG